MDCFIKIFSEQISIPCLILEIFIVFVKFSNVLLIDCWYSLYISFQNLSLGTESYAFSISKKARFPVPCYFPFLILLAATKTSLVQITATLVFAHYIPYSIATYCRVFFQRVYWNDYLYLVSCNSSFLFPLLKNYLRFFPFHC